MDKPAKAQKSAYRQVISISLPLAMSMAATTVMEFTDRVFLANYSLEAIAAVVPAGITAFLFIAFFLGVAGYVNVFIAQYTGAGAHHRVGPCLWQGIWFTFFAALALGSLVFIAEPLFLLSGHSLEVQQLEVTYFSILCGGAGLNVAAGALACFFSGRGYTRPVMAVSFLGMLFNIPLDYALINGLWIFPEMGIAGAGIATVSAWGLMALTYGLLIFTPKNIARYSLWRKRAFDRELFTRLLKFGVPGSLQFCLDVFAFTFFILMVGRIGVVLLRFVAAYVCVDALYMVYSGVLKGAGDTKFLMLAIGSLSLVCMILPVSIGIIWFGAGLYFAWSCVVFFIVALFLMSWWRYLGGKWKIMRVIE